MNVTPSSTLLPRGQLPVLAKIALGIGLAPILLWPVAAGLSFFAFDEGASVAAYTLFIISWTYPLPLLANAWLARKLYFKKPFLANLLMVWPILLLLIIAISVFFS
jgi:hypothetical protein